MNFTCRFATRPFQEENLWNFFLQEVARLRKALGCRNWIWADHVAALALTALNFCIQAIER